MSEHVRLADVADLAMGETIIAQNCDGRGLPIYSAATSDAPWNHSSRFLRKLRRGTIVVGARGSIGFPRMPTDELFGATQTTITVSALSDAILPRFLLHALRGIDYQSLTAQQAIPMLTVAEFGEVAIPRVSIDEQSRVADILDTLDTAIRQTEAIIEKLKLVKQGLLHDLLTRGIDENGELRPPQSKAPHLYKQSALGWTPLGWRVARLGDLSATMTNGFVGTAAPHYSDDGDAVPYLYGNNVRPNAVDASSCIRVTRRFHRQQVKSQLAPDDLLTVQSGHIGTTAVVPQDLGEANCHALIITRLADTRVMPEFVALYCNSPLGLKDMSGIFVGSTIPHINVKDFKRFQIPLPEAREEQAAVSAALRKAELRLDGAVTELAKLRTLRFGLMDDLLTGRVRVTPLLGTVPSP